MCDNEVISISNGLLPDLKAEELANKEKKKKNQIIIADFSYDNSLEETDDAMKTFQKRFSSKRGKLSVIAYSLLAAAAIAAIIFNPTQIVLYFSLAFCIFGLVYTLTDKMRMRSRVLDTLSKMKPEDYHCVIYDNRIEIETMIRENEDNSDKEKPAPAEENVENPDNIEVDNEEKPVEPIKSVFKFGEDMLDFIESERSLLLILARRQIYCFPKRCLSEEQQNAVRDFLTKKLSEISY